MRGYAVIAVLTLAPGLWPAGNKLTWEDRVELTRGLTAEYATVKVLLPRSSKPLEFDAKSGYDKNQWTADRARERSGGAHRRPGAGDQDRYRRRQARAADQRRLQGRPQVVSGRADRHGRSHGAGIDEQRYATRRAEPPSRSCSTSRSSPSRRRRSRRCWRRCWISKSTA